MMFLHESPEFLDLLAIAAAERRLPQGLVEKDYWVTHTLWALEESGLAVWFKGGTSLSKGYGLVERFSEDLDLKLEPGTTGLSPVTNWKSEGAAAVRERTAYFAALSKAIAVPGTTTTLDTREMDPSWRSAFIHVGYPGTFLHELDPAMRPYVLLEVGSARVTPYLSRDMTSFVHDVVEASGQLAAFVDNRPRGVRCVHPLVTLLEKLDAISRRFPRDDLNAASFVRHYEDAAHIIRESEKLPRLYGYGSVRALADEMLAEKQLRSVPVSHDPAFVLANGRRTDELHRAHQAIAGMFWGERIPLAETGEAMRSWILQHLT
jgi:hypothetical protein